MKKSKIYDGIMIIILAVLLSFSICWQYENKSGSEINLLIFSLIAGLIGLVLYLIWSKLSNLKLKKVSNLKKWEFIVFGVIVLSALTIAATAYYPGYTTFDSATQWGQVQSNSYNNWHPVLHTLFALKLPSLIYNDIFAATIFQMLIIGAILIYFCYFCRKNFLNFPQTLLVLLVIVANPLFFKYSATIWKDILFSWMLFLVTLYLINIVLSDGKWLNKKGNIIFFLLATFGVMGFRHNGILPVLCMFIWLIIFYPQIRKTTIISCISLFAAFFIITGPIYKAVGIFKETGGKDELLGEVMGQIAYYYHYGVDFSQKELKILDDILPLEEWQTYYNPRVFNYLKWSAPNYSTVAKKNFGNILKMYFSKTIHYPGMFMRSFFNMTSPIWETKNTIADASYTLADKNNYPINGKSSFDKISDQVYEKMIEYNNLVVTSPIRWLFVSIGQGMWFLILSLMLLIRHNKFKWQQFLPLTLVLSNSLLIMLLITGEEYRFVYAQAICVIPLLIYSLFYYSKNKSKEVKEK